MFRLGSCAIVFGLALAFGTAAAEGPEPPPPSQARAVELYDGGRYAEARQELERLDREQSLDGAQLYRLYYCQNLGGAPEAPQTLTRAIRLLEQEHAQGGSLAGSFYLVNAYTNAGKTAEARRVAAEATARFGGDAASGPADPVDRFRLGKLYADQQKGVEAEHWYEAALPGLEKAGQTAYVTWASRYLAEAAYSRAEYAEAEAHLTRLIAMAERPPVNDLDRLAVCRARIGMYAEAGQAWRRALLLDPANGDRARYSAMLVEAAGRLPEIPATAPDGRPWTQLDRSELEQVLNEQSAEARAVHEAGRDWKKLDAASKKSLQQRLDRARPLFVAAGLEYTLQGHPIREAAFSGGYAPLIFQDNEWQLPKPN